MNAARFLVSLALAAAAASPAAAAVSTGEPAALLVFPLIRVDGTTGDDTLVQITNTDAAAVGVRCIYENPSATRPFAPFAFRLAANQPIAWRASAGGAVPGDAGVVPALGTGSFTGVLRCLTAEANGAPSDRNVLVGSVTLERFTSGAPAAAVDSAQYNAFGFDAQPGAVNADDQLVLGGPAAEYAACPESVVLQSPFDGAVLALGTGGTLSRVLSNTLAMVTCAQGVSSAASATLALEITNEFGMRTSTVGALHEQLVVALSRIDSPDPTHSLFSATVQGTPTGVIDIKTLSGSGVLALTLQSYAHPNDNADLHDAAIAPQLVGERSDPDVVDLAVPTQMPTPVPTPACVGDCDGNGSVAINELITGVNIALGSLPVSTCLAFDADASGSVAINEVITAVNNALAGCS